jgi:hypothetical protein
VKLKKNSTLKYFQNKLNVAFYFVLIFGKKIFYVWNVEEMTCDECDYFYRFGKLEGIFLREKSRRKKSENFCEIDQ